MVRRSGIISGPIWGSFPVRGSFAVQFGDHFRSGDHLRVGIICGPVQHHKRRDLGFFFIKQCSVYIYFTRKPKAIAFQFSLPDFDVLTVVVPMNSAMFTKISRDILPTASVNTSGSCVATRS